MLELVEQLGNVFQACRLCGYSCDSFFRFKEINEHGGELDLQKLCRRKPIIKNRIAPNVEEAAAQFAKKQPAMGQFRVSNEFNRQGSFVSPETVRCVWLCHDLETFRKRLKALETKVVQEGLILAQAQVVALQKVKDQEEASGKIETHHSGYLGAKDTYYQRTIKGVGRIYQ